MEEYSRIIKYQEKKNFENQRNYGIDLLRMLSMLNIIILHINLYSNQLNLRVNNKKFKSIWRLEAMSYFAVDCFGLISGIVGYKKYKFANLIYIWINASFYSSIFSLYLYFINRTNFKYMILSFFPILICRYWYINAYFKLYLFIPFLNFGMNNLNKRTYKNLICFYILFFPFYHLIRIILNVKRKDINFLNNGYSPYWLIILYIIGGYLGKYIIINKNKTNAKFAIICTLIYLFSAFISSESFFILIKKYNQINNKELLINYLSPTIISESLSLIMIFSKLSINNKIVIKIISFYTPLTLNAYFLHCRLFNEKFISFNWMNKLKPNIICLEIYLLGIIIFFFCVSIDYLRAILFKYLKIKQFCMIIENKFSKLM